MYKPVRDKYGYYMYREYMIERQDCVGVYVAWPETWEDGETNMIGYGNSLSEACAIVDQHLHERKLDEEFEAMSKTKDLFIQEQKDKERLQEQQITQDDMISIECTTCHGLGNIEYSYFPPDHNCYTLCDDCEGSGKQKE